MDNAATTPVSPAVLEKMLPYFSECYGNANSIHSTGLDARKALNAARKKVAAALNCNPEEVYFTSGGSESDNWALKGVAFANRKKGNHIITSAILHTCEWLEKQGFEITYVPVDADGLVNPADVEAAITDKTILISIMAANNEIGTIEPIEEIAKIAHAHHVLFHTDAVQAIGAISVDVRAIGCDLLSLSGHKFHGPKGVGALYVKKGVRLSPIVFGGLQEEKLRPGTQPMPAIAGFGAAAAALPNLTAQLKKVTELRDYMCERLLSLGGVVINSPEDALPYVTNISVLGINSEPMLNFLSSRGVYVSSGSACSKGHQSSVLKNMGLSDEVRKSPLRISFSRFTTKEEIDMLIDGISAGQKAIRKNK